MVVENPGVEMNADAEEYVDIRPEEEVEMRILVVGTRILDA